MKVKIIVVVALLIIPIAWYLLMPLKSSHFKLESNSELLSSKKAFLESPPSSRDSMAKPNILWIIVDDLGYYDTDLYGEGLVETPHINRLADEGVRFTEGFTTSPVCSPSRAAILTGRYNQRFGFEHQLHDRYLRNRMEYLGFKYVVNNAVWQPIKRDSVPDQAFVDAIGLPLSEISIAEVVKKQGYRTGLIGKWHVSKQIEQSPNAFGFDEFYGFYSSHSLYTPEGTPGIVDMKNPADWTDDYIWSGQREGRQAIQRNGKVIEEDRYLTTAIADESIEFIKQNGEDPFFLITSFNAPHTPFQVPQAYYDAYAHVSDPVKRTYYGMIKCLDDEIGRLLDYIEEQELDENTVVFLVSDNGGAAYTFATDNAPLKGGKITNFDGGVKVPFIIKAPGYLTGQEYNQPVSTTDLFVSTAALVGQELPDRTYDGVDLLSKVNSNATAHDYLYYRKGFNRMIRTSEYKLIWNAELDSDTLLYKIVQDPEEQNNVYKDNKALAEEMLIKYNAWEKELRAPLWPSVVHFNFRDVEERVFVFEN
jgi:arylsulfatase A-like enzyme